MITTEEETNIPQNVGAEEALLGTCITDSSNDFYDSIAHNLSAEDFYLYKHRLIYKSISALATRGEDVNEITLIEELKKSSALDEVDGMSGIISVMDNAASALQCQSLVQVVKDKANLRLLRRSFKLALQDVEDETKDPESVRADIESALLHLDKGSKNDMSLKGTIEKLEVDFEKQLKGEYNHEAIRTHMDHLDTVLGNGGIGLGEVMVVSAPTSCGKSQLALNVAARAMLRDQTPVGIFSLEMPKEQIAKRLLTIKSQANLKQIRDRVISDKHMDRVREGCEALKDLPVYTVSSIKSISDLCSYARTMVRRHKVKFIIIDYLQLIPFDTKNTSKNDAIANISHTVKQLALELNVGIMLLSQVNREGAKREGGLAIYDLKDSGDIENDADVILLMWPENNDMEMSKRIDGSGSYINMKYNIAKNREGERDVSGQFKFYHTKGLFY